VSRPIRVGTRGSALALAQSSMVAAALSEASGRQTELVRIRTEGDANAGPLAVIGGTGVFVVAVREALLDGRIDVAVHSFKDLPTAEEPSRRVVLAAVPAREDPADALCAASMLADLALGAQVGTGSPRRSAQLRRLRPDLAVLPVRGNVDTRLSLVVSGRLDAVVLAKSGLGRLGRLDAVSQVFSPDEMLPAPAQGALAVETLADHPDDALIAALATLDDAASRAAATAERAVLGGLQAGCAAPIGALATVSGTSLALRARVIAADGRGCLDASETADVSGAAEAGRRVAETLLSLGAGDLVGALR
jgi:hydroxymethylbilane synthase